MIIAVKAGLSALRLQIQGSGQPLPCTPTQDAFASQGGCEFALCLSLGSARPGQSYAQACQGCRRECHAQAGRQSPNGQRYFQPVDQENLEEPLGSCSEHWKSSCSPQ